MILLTNAKFVIMKYYCSVNVFFPYLENFERSQFCLLMHINNFLGKLTSGHFLCEKHDHLCEVDWTRGLRKHALGLTIGDGFADGAESSNNVAGGQETVLIGVHDTEGFFELLDLPLREESKHIGATLLGFPEIEYVTYEWNDLTSKKC